jgi:hypothetical protein
MALARQMLLTIFTWLKRKLRFRKVIEHVEMLESMNGRRMGKRKH